MFWSLLSICLLFTLATGQNFLVPFTWRKPTSNLSREVREELAYAVAESVSTLFNATSGKVDVLEAAPDNVSTNPADQSAYLLTAMSRTDFLSGNTTFQSVVVNSLDAAFQLNSRISTVSLSTRRDLYHPLHEFDHITAAQVNNDLVIAWGLAAITAYRAYNDTNTLNYAIAMWNQTLSYQIQPSDVARGRHQLQNVTLPPSCDGSSIVGGVFQDAGDSTPDVAAESVAAFMALSAHLFEATGDARYLGAAESAAEFTQAHLYSNSIIQGAFLVDSCQLRPMGPLSYYSGFAIWGLSVLMTHNQTWTPFLLNIISLAVPYPMQLASNVGWTNASDGIIIEHIPTPTDTVTNSIYFTMRTVLIRGLHEAWSRMDATSAAATFIQSYLLVQFNALIDLASLPGSNQYSASWEGPPEPSFQAWGQLSALDVLNSAFAMVAAGNGSTSSGPAPTSTFTASSASSPTASALNPANNTVATSKVRIIAGAAVGAAVLLCIIAMVTLARVKQRRRKTAHASGEPVAERRPNGLIDPFQYAATSMPEWTKGDGTRRYLSLSLTHAGENVPIGSHHLLVGTPEASSSAEQQGPSSSPQITGSTAAPMEGDPNDLPQAIAQLDRVLARMAAALDDDAPPRYE